MKYLLDFDRTLFDVEQLYVELAQCGQSQLAGTVESFAYVSIADLLFSDVAEFLADKNKSDLFILSSASGLSAQWETDYQTAKITASGLDKKVASVHVVPGDKGAEAVKIASQFAPHEQIIFIDDRLENCQAVKTALPNAHIYLLKRHLKFDSKQQTRQTIPIITSLAEVTIE